MTIEEPQRGRLIVIAAPSGAGKTTLVHALLDRVPNLRFSISYTTRPKRPNETDGADYFFIDDARFAAMAEGGEFIEHAKVFDYRYGTGKAHTESLLTQGFSVLLEIDWQGARQVREQVADAVSVFIMPPSVGELERRLRGRATDSDATIARRLADSVSDMSHWDEFDYVVVNDRVERATEELQAIVAGQGEASSIANSAVRERVRAILAD